LKPENRGTGHDSKSGFPKADTGLPNKSEETPIPSPGILTQQNLTNRFIST
jgi:hypothetical protein